MVCFFFQAEDGIRDLVRSRGLGDVYKRQKILIPAIVVIGAAVSMAASLIAQLPGSQLMLPINVVTSLFGAPFVVWVLLKRKRGAASFNV